MDPPRPELSSGQGNFYYKLFCLLCHKPCDVNTCHAFRGRGPRKWASADINKIVCTPDDDEEDDSHNFYMKKDEEAWCRFLNPKKCVFYPEGHQKWMKNKQLHEEEQTYRVNVQKPPSLHHIDLNT